MAGDELKNNFNQENDKKITNNNKRMMTKLDIKINLRRMKLKKKFQWKIQNQIYCIQNNKD